MKRMLSILLALLLLSACIPAVLAEAGTWTCPTCGKTNKQNFCTNDGTPRPEEKETAAAPGTVDDGTWTCPTCGRTCEDNYCSHDATPRPQGQGNTAAGKNTVSAGQYVTFGSYKQNNDFFCNEIDKEPILWQVLDVKEGKALLLSYYGLDTLPYNETGDKETITWKECTLRSWLNTAFLDTAFSREESRSIVAEGVKTDGIITEDYLFLLSSEEVKQYLPGDEKNCTATPYNGGLSKCDWWLRSRDRERGYSAIGGNGVYCHGSLDCKRAVRPALWVWVSALQNISDAPAGIKEAKLESGKTVTFGSYPQGPNGEIEPIEWIVTRLYTDRDDTLILMSKYILDCRPYNTKNTSVTWETCTLRKWLNGTFLEQAFTEKEQTALTEAPVMVKGYGNCQNGGSVDYGNETEDRVFLLNSFDIVDVITIRAKDLAEADEIARCAPTAYAKKQGCKTDKKRTLDGELSAAWWLNDVGNTQSRAWFIQSSGAIDEKGTAVNSKKIGVRPVICVRLNVAEGLREE